MNLQMDELACPSKVNIRQLYDAAGAQAAAKGLHESAHIELNLGKHGYLVRLRASPTA